MDATKEQLMASLAKLQKQMSSLIDDYMDRDRADTAKFMTKRTALDNRIRETKDAIAAHPE